MQQGPHYSWLQWKGLDPVKIIWRSPFTLIRKTAKSENHYFMLPYTFNMMMTKAVIKLSKMFLKNGKYTRQTKMIIQRIKRP